jgi:uncharacterized protein (DUF58 family)
MSQFNDRAVRQFGKLEFLARQVVEGFITGLHHSPYHGFSVEFAEHRAYNNGESTRHIDWKLFGKTEKLYTKRYEEETNLRCHILIDQSSSMYFPKDGEETKFSFSVKAAAALIHLLRTQRDAVGLGLFDEEVREITPAKLSQRHFNYLYYLLEEKLDYDGQSRSTAAASALHELAERINKRSVVVIFSDMFESSEAGLDKLFSALQHLRFNKHEVILFHTVDQSHEIDFEYDNRPYKFVDMESGEVVKLNPSEIKDEYRKQLKSYKEELKLRCHQNKVDFVEADINQGFSKILMAYLARRKKMI